MPVLTTTTFPISGYTALFGGTLSYGTNSITVHGQSDGASRTITVTPNVATTLGLVFSNIYNYIAIEVRDANNNLLDLRYANAPGMIPTSFTSNTSTVTLIIHSDQSYSVAPRNGIFTLTDVFTRGTTMQPKSTLVKSATGARISTSLGLMDR